MRSTLVLSRGFWGRSVDEFKRLSKIALTLEGIKGPSGPFDLYNFHHPESVKGCQLMCDVDMGGSSTAHLDWVPVSSSSSSSSSQTTTTQPPQPQQPQKPTPPKGYARFHGTISTALPDNQPKLERSGFAAWRTTDRGANLFGRGTWDMGMYAFLALRVRSDGRSYMINVQTEGIVPSDLHQHRLFSKRASGRGGEWETVLLKWNDFVRTNHGFVVEPQTEILRHRVRSIGVGLTDRVPGPFELHIERMWATNNLDEADGPDAGASSVAAEASELTDKQGRKIKWGD